MAFFDKLLKSATICLDRILRACYTSPSRFQRNRGDRPGRRDSPTIPVTVNGGLLPAGEAGFVETATVVTVLVVTAKAEDGKANKDESGVRRL
jgi:hypothetical protein